MVPIITTMSFSRALPARAAPARNQGMLSLSSDPDVSPQPDVSSQHDQAQGLRTPAVKSIEVRRSARRKRTISAKLDKGSLIVYLPAGMSRAEEAEWVEKMRGRMEAQHRRKALNSGADLERRARELNASYFDSALRWKSVVYVTNQRDRYGSCTFDDATIRISDVVADMPAWVRDYILIHELSHLLVPDHSQEFWSLVERYPLTERARGFLIAKGLEE